MVVYNNVIVQASKPIKGVYVVNKKYLPSLLIRLAGSAQGLKVVWEARDKLADWFT